MLFNVTHSQTWNMRKEFLDDTGNISSSKCTGNGVVHGKFARILRVGAANFFYCLGVDLRVVLNFPDQHVR
jgi:hypothetical protein